MKRLAPVGRAKHRNYIFHSFINHLFFMKSLAPVNILRLGNTMVLDLVWIWYGI